MCNKIKQMIKGIEHRPPASNDAIKNFEEEANIILPDEYKIFLGLTNGGEGFVGEVSYVMFWAIEEILELNEAYNVHEYIPGLLIFGSNGGGEAYAFDTRSSTMEIVQVPFVGMTLDLAQQMAKSFNEFLENIYQIKEDE